MSWLFGLNKGDGSGQVPSNPYLPPPPASGDGGDPNGPPKDAGQDDKGRDSKMEAYRFDSGALERAAKAAKELEKSSKLIPVLLLILYFS